VLFPLANKPYSSMVLVCLIRQLMSSLFLCVEQTNNRSYRRCHYPSVSRTGENALGVLVRVNMIQTRIILYFCMYGIQIEQEKQNTSEKKTKVKYFLLCVFVVVLCCVSVYHTGAREKNR
jgi:hypothetical protein